MKRLNETLFVIGYGSLQSGCGLLGMRRGGQSRLTARNAFPVALSNARRGLAKPSQHGKYLAMDIEPIDRSVPISGKIAPRAAGNEIGALGLTFDRTQAPDLARREEYDPDRLLELLGIADRAGRPLGEFLMEIAERTGFDLLSYRCELYRLLNYTSPGYIFHPVGIEGAGIGLVAIGSGYDGSGHRSVTSRRREFAMDRLLGVAEALGIAPDREGQLDYFTECILGGMHGLNVDDLIDENADGSGVFAEIAQRVAAAAPAESLRFFEATSLREAAYARAFAPVAEGRFSRMLRSARARRRRIGL
ncbi:MAG TPA: hypothetical protein VGI47_07265 [Candidatus Binataceae bacterium]